MTELQKFALENRVLFWDMSEKAISNLSEGAITERFLSYGDWKQVHKLETILWLERESQLFFERANRPRTNFRPETLDFFTHYFQKRGQKVS